MPLETDWWEPPEWLEESATHARPVRPREDYGADTLWTDRGIPLSSEFVTDFVGEDRSAEEEAFTSAEDEHEANARSTARAGRKLGAQRKALREAITKLTDRQRFVVERRIGLDDNEIYSFSDLADCMGISPQAVQQIEADATTRLKTLLEPQLCVVCESPLTGRRSGATTCSDACRKAKSRNGNAF